MSGILEGIIKNFEKSVIQNRGVVDIQHIAQFVRDLQARQYDAHLVIMGNNGQGKSMLMLALMKLLDEKSIFNKQIVYAYDKTSRLIELLKNLNESVIGIDEGKKFFHYKQSMTTEQITLTNMIEYARENRNAFIVCANDIRRLNSNYRNAKVQMVVWLLDRFEGKKIKSYGLVFVGNPALEEDDKFLFNSFQNLYSFESIRLVAESLPTFYGYLFLDDIKKYVSEDELLLYNNEKRKGIQAVADEYLRKLSKKEDDGILNKNFVGYMQKFFSSKTQPKNI